MSGTLKGHSARLFGSHGPQSMLVDWSDIHPEAATYQQLWVGQLYDEFGPVAREVLKQQHQTRLMVLELAQALYIHRDLQAS